MNHEPEISIGDNIKILDEYLEKIILSIGITDEGTIQQIKKQFQKYPDKTFKLINLDQPKINELLAADGKLAASLKNFSEFENKDFKQKWDNLMQQFVILQGLIIIRKANKDIQAGFKSLIEALENKLKIALNLLEQDI